MFSHEVYKSFHCLFMYEANNSILFGPRFPFVLQMLEPEINKAIAGVFKFIQHNNDFSNRSQMP